MCSPSCDPGSIPARCSQDIGWGPGQLEREVEYGVWRAIPATAAEIFSNGDNLWERLLRQAFDSLLQVMCNVKHIPSDASLN